MSGFVAYRQLDPDMLQQVGQSVLQILQLESLQMAATNMVTILDDLIRMFGDESIALQFNIEEIERKISKAAKGQQNAQHSENSTSAKDSNIVHSSNDREGRSVAQQPTAGDLHSLESVTKPASGADSEDQSTSSSHPPEIPVIEIEHTHAGSDRSGPKSPRRHGAVTARSRLPSGGSKRISAHPRKKKPLDTAVESSCKRIAEVSDPQILSSLLIQLVKLHPELSRDVLLFLTGPITRNSVEFPRDDLSPSLHSKISFTVDLPKSDGSSEGTLDE
ncbi:MAG: hypothetical protein Q8P67_14170 [archaeon]|nr:hypothetical protein [archaeon]